jgi:hypothetical protein
VNYSRKLTLVLLLAAAAGTASAQQFGAPQQGGLSRAQVKAELAAAIRNGDMMAPGELGLTERQVRPDLYPSTHVAGKTRAQVEAELSTAIRNGDMIANGELGLRDKDLEPGMYPADPVVAGKTRAQVESELAMAIRDGDMMANDQSGLTEYQERPQLFAHQRALDAASLLVQHDAPQTDGTATN